MKRFQLDDSLISNPSPETGIQTFPDTKGEDDVGDADFSKSLKVLEKGSEIFEWREVARG